ncbi:hypothetical protein [Pseudorhodoferax sp. Leaf274]|uniref:hypothetical protein n=1 Tax=Pseudorhodoferax sp. Leaf274 TaxID=1736318 RepID=UPI0007031F57|nr:hypothetical protein [Pseudorhodoferax sp. Leaf274]KQP35433.1 hypothetical protein ASF44_19000 [Pseudorhodoferax sp. Leaf274]
MALQLTLEQQRALEALALQRDLAQVGAALARAFPEAAARIGERQAALLELGWRRAQALGLAHALALARYLAAWFVFGVEFETRPGFEWAQQALVQDQASEGLRVFQLGRRSREELQRHAAKPGTGLPAPAVFDAALALLDAELAGHGAMGSLLPRERLVLGSACDIDAVDVTQIESGVRQHYAVEQGRWQRVPTGLDAELQRVLSTQGNAPLPAQLHLLGAADSSQARLRLRCLARHVCDAKVHPLVNFNGVHGHYDRRGPMTQDLLVTLPHEPPRADGPAAMAAGSPAAFSELTVAGCGLRDSGAPMGEQHVALAVYPPEQHMLAWRREPSPGFDLPAQAPPPAAAPRGRRECDGKAQDVQALQAGLAQLDTQLAEGLARLFIAWERESGVESGRLQAEPAVLAGGAGLTWGWAASPDGLAAAPFYRVAGLLDLVACQLDLRLSGELALQGTRSRLHLHCAAREELRFDAQRGPRDDDLAAVFKPAQCVFRHPFVLHLENIATPELAMLDALQPVAGAVVGAAGLRPHPAGAGLQWFARIAVEPVVATLHLHDPLLGQQRLLPHPLLPAMTLVDWSLD